MYVYLIQYHTKWTALKSRVLLAGQIRSHTIAVDEKRCSPSFSNTGRLEEETAEASKARGQKPFSSL
jgi:hypothetical protein